MVERLATEKSHSARDFDSSELVRRANSIADFRPLYLSDQRVPCRRLILDGVSGDLERPKQREI